MSNSYCVFSTADDKYALYAAVSLLTVRRFNNKIPLYILSSKLSSTTKSTLDNLGVHYIETDLSNEFTKTWEYPLECYYIFAGPELLYKEGFSHSIYMDGDVLCKKDPLANDFKFKIKTFAGVSAGDISLIFGKELDTIRQLWPNRPATKPRINSGVVYFNNEAMKKLKMLSNTGKLFRKCLQNNIPRKGDDSLFALFQLVHQQDEVPQVLPNGFNFIPQYNDSQLQSLPHPQLRSEITFFHFGGDGMNKPWTKDAHSHGSFSYTAYDPLTDEWRSVAKKVLQSNLYKALIASSKPKFVRKLLSLTTRPAR